MSRATHERHQVLESARYMARHCRYMPTGVLRPRDIATCYIAGDTPRVCTATLYICIGQLLATAALLSVVLPVSNASSTAVAV